jgi:hypothetical protein
MRSARLLAAVALLVVLLALTGSVHAEEPLLVRASEVQVSFPRGVSFRLEVESPAGIADVQLQVNTPGRRYGAAVRNVRPNFTPGGQVVATWTWQRFGNQLPPGAEITYRWRITEVDGRVTETPQTSVRVEDGRHPWQTLSDGPITVRWYRGGDAFGREVLAAAQESAARLRDLQGVDLRYPLTIHVYGSQNELFEAVPGAPGWIGGIAIPEFDTVLIGIEPSNLPWGRRALTHEMAHQLVYQMTAHPTLGSRVPTWLNEGLAVVAEGETELRSQQLLDQAIADGTLPTLRALSSPFSAQTGHLAGVSYTASESAVRFLLDEHGPEAMRAMLTALSEGLSPDEAARRAYGRSLDRLEDGWRASLGLDPFDRGDPAAATSPDDGSTEQSQQRAGAADDSRWIVWLALGLGGLTLIVIVAGGWLVVRRLHYAGRKEG